MAAFWKLEQLRKWYENDDGEGEGGEPGDDGEEGDGDGEGEPGSEAGNEPGDDGDGEPGDGGEGGEGEGDDAGEPDDDAGSAPPSGSGGTGQAEGGNKPLDPKDFQNLDKLDPSEVRDPNLKIGNEAGESSTPEKSQKPAAIMDPVEERIEPMDAESGTRSTREWTQKLRSIRAGALRLALRRLLQRSDYAGREGNLREGRLGRGVARLLNGAENVFDRRYEVDGESVAVSLLIDRSGSMGGSKMNAAAEAALLIGETCANAGAKLEVVAFDSSYNHEVQAALTQTMMEETSSIGENPHTTGKWLFAAPSAVYVCKSFAQSIGHLRRMYTTMRHMANGGTNDSSALKWVGERLLKTDANRKILFVIADGIGDSTAVFRYVVNGLEQKGVIVIGIGIGCNPKKFAERFTYSVAIENVTDLCSKAFGLLIGTIAKARGIAA